MRTPIKTNLNNSFNNINTQDIRTKSQSSKICIILKPLIAPLFIMASLSVLILLVFVLDNQLIQSVSRQPCTDNCRVTLVESIPENITFSESSPIFPSTFSAWQRLLDITTESIDLAVYYWTLKNEDVTPVVMESAWQGEAIFQQLLDKARDPTIEMRIAQNIPSSEFPQNNSAALEQEGAQVRSLDFDKLIGAGILHTKMWIVDGTHFYLGSANMDWQSLTQVKEVGVLVENCSCLAQDLGKVFEVYWILGNSSTVPPTWPDNLSTEYNIENPMKLNLSDIESNAAVSSSPPSFNPDGRTSDVDAIVAIIRNAKKFVYIAVMDYFPRMLYTSKQTFWPVIDDELRRAALENEVEVKLLASHWNHTREDLVRWLGSLQDLSGQSYPAINIETKLFVVPAYTEDQKLLPFARVNHDKFMVTDSEVYVGTSNWSGDYFVNTAGVSLAVSHENTTSSEVNNTLRAQLESLFLRDWNSEFARPIEEFITGRIDVHNEL